MFNLPHQKLVLAIIPVKAKKSKILWFNISFFKREVKVLVGKTKAAVQAVLGKRCSENMQQIYRRTPMPKCDFNKVALQLTAYFQNIFSEEHLWRTGSVRIFIKFFQEHFPKTNRLLRFFFNKNAVNVT